MLLTCLVTDDVVIPMPLASPLSIQVLKSFSLTRKERTITPRLAWNICRQTSGPQSLKEVSTLSDIDNDRRPTRTKEFLLKSILDCGLAITHIRKYHLARSATMPRGEVNHIKVHYRGHGDEDFLVFVDNVEDYHKWLHDHSVPLSHVVSSFKVFTTHK